MTKQEVERMLTALDGIHAALADLTNVLEGIDTRLSSLEDCIGETKTYSPQKFLRVDDLSRPLE